MFQPKPALLLWALLLTFSVPLFAQVKTQDATLRTASASQSTREKQLAQQLQVLARQKKWPLVLQLSRQRTAVLTGVDVQGHPLYVSTDNNILAAATLRTNLLWPGGSTGLNLNGSSPNMKDKLAVWDGGRVLATHQELAGRINQRDNPSATNDHATHVSGTLIASGVNPLAKGMSYGLQELLAYDFNSHISEMLGAAPGLLVSNHSYGTLAGWSRDDNGRWLYYGQTGSTEDYKFGYYSSESELWDSIAYNAPYYLIVKSAGNNRQENGPAEGGAYYNAANPNTQLTRPPGMSSNDGYDIIPTYGTAKNILTVGAVNPIASGYTRPGDVVMSAFSSWGPTDDGRIKPDVVADGVDLLSSIATANNAYASYSGTSMASPNAAGSILLLQEYYSRLHSGAFLRAATLKGLAIHTADEAGIAPGPDYQFGWGLLNLEKAAAVITSNNTTQLIQENVLTNGGSYSLPVIASGKGRLSVTLSWTDPRTVYSTTKLLNDTTPKLINDLDIRVKKGSNTYMPWTLNPAVPAANATTGDNRLDNVERIDIPDAIPGETYTIEVTHKGTLQRGSQAYSLIVSGAGGQAYCTSAATAGTGAQIDSLVIGTLHLSNPTGCSGYTNSTASIINIEPNSSLPFIISTGSCDGSNNPRMVKAFMDFNNDGDFDDAGELVAQSNVLGVGNFTGTISIPGVTVGNIFVLRIIVQETSSAASISACGSYTAGQTQDLRVLVNSPSNDIALVELVSPQASFCATGSQYLTVRLKNKGSVARSNIALSATVQSGIATIATITGNYPGSIDAGAELLYTFQQPFKAVAGTSYTITTDVTLANDQNPDNNEQITTVIVNSATTPPAGQAIICGTTQATLQVGNASTADIYSWYDSPTATTPIATGSPVTTTVIPASQTYYLAKNDQDYKGGIASKTAFTDGGYSTGSNLFIKFTNTLPVTIETVKLYVGNPGKVKITLGDLASFNTTTGAYSYYPLSSTIIDVYATDPTPQSGSQAGNDPADTGAVFAVNLPVTSAGDHILIVQLQNGATLFQNTNIATNPYPITTAGFFSVTGNSYISSSNTNYYQRFYPYLYNFGLRLANCGSTRTAVTATAATAPVITANGNILSSSSVSGNQWYRNGVLLPNEINPTITPTVSGTYKVVVTDFNGCALASNEIPFTITAVPDINVAAISLKVLPNPNDGRFTVQFRVNNRANLELTLTNVIGQPVYQRVYPGFTGSFNEPLNLGTLAAGIYQLKIQHGNKSYIKKIIIR